MAQDPWRRAYQLQQVKQGAAPPPGTPGRRHRNPWRAVGWLALALVVVGAAGYCAWLYRERWLPATWPVRAKLPAPVRDALPAAHRSVDQAQLEQGLGVDLTLFASTLDLIEATRGWGVEWKLTSTGAQRTRLAGPGVKVEAQNDVIEFYDLDVAQVFASPEWQPWWTVLRSAGISPELSWKLLTGEDAPAGNLEYEYRSRELMQHPLGRVRRAFVLRFVDGYLRHVEGQISLGPMRVPGPVTHAPPQVEDAAGYR